MNTLFEELNFTAVVELEEGTEGVVGGKGRAGEGSLNIGTSGLGYLRRWFVSSQNSAVDCISFVRYNEGTRGLL